MLSSFDVVKIGSLPDHHHDFLLYGPCGLSRSSFCPTMARTKHMKKDKVVHAPRSAPTSDFIDVSNVLKPSVPDQDPDDWPCFELKDAVVYSKDGKRFASLLLAELEGPFTIQGTLHLTSEQSTLSK